MVPENKNDDFMVGRINVSPQHNMMTSSEQSCNLQPKVMAVLHYLAKNSDRVINNDELLEHVWHGRVVTNSSIQKCVNALRAAFTELDSSGEYVVYFSKRGYQLVSPDINPNNPVIAAHSYKSRTIVLIASSALLFILLSYLFYSFKTGDRLVPGQANVTQYSQVKPYASNTGREVIIEPHSDSERLALIRHEYTGPDHASESHLFIHGMNGKEWQASVARGGFTKLAWSPSGRNLVAIDVHNENKQLSKTDKHLSSTNYSTFHIYTFDFKGKKMIEKNILSHWQGNVNSVSWWDEGTIEFTASQGNQYQLERYRYNIADQNLSKLDTPTELGELLSTHIFNKKAAILSLLNSAEQIQFVNESEQFVNKWPIPFKVIAMSWVSDGSGVLLLSDDNQLSLLSTDGQLHAVDYSPKITGDVTHVRSINNGRNIVLTVQSPREETKTQFNTETHDKSEVKDTNLLSERFMQKSGGFIYSTTMHD